MEKRARGAAVAAACLVAATLAQAGGVKAGALQQRRCLTATCTVLVNYGAGSAGNNCGVSVPDVVFVYAVTNTVQWKLPPPPTGQPNHRFRGGRVTIDDNNDNPNEPGGSGSTPMFNNGALADSDRIDPKTLSATGRTTVKVFTYSIAVEREKAGGGWENCDLVDPVIVNRGN